MAKLEMKEERSMAPLISSRRCPRRTLKLSWSVGSDVNNVSKVMRGLLQVIQDTFIVAASLDSTGVHTLHSTNFR